MRSPGDFLTYVRRRTDSATSRLLMAGDELDVVMWFFEGGMYFEPDPFLLYKKYPTTMRPRQADRVRYKKSNKPTQVGTHTDALDAWMYFKEGQTGIEAPRPERKHSEPLAAVIGQLENRKGLGWLRTSADLSGLSRETEELIGGHIEQLVHMTIADSGFHTSAQTYVTPWGNIGVFLGSKPRGHDFEIYAERLRTYARLKKYQLQLDRATTILLDTSGSIAWSDYINAPYAFDAALEREVAGSGGKWPTFTLTDAPRAARRKTQKEEASQEATTLA